MGINEHATKPFNTSQTFHIFHPSRLHRAMALRPYLSSLESAWAGQRLLLWSWKIRKDIEITCAHDKSLQVARNTDEWPATASDGKGNVRGTGGLRSCASEKKTRAFALCRFARLQVTRTSLFKVKQTKAQSTQQLEFGRSSKPFETDRSNTLVFLIWTP